MGRTVLPARLQFDEEITELSRFRDALRKEDRELFDAIILSARKHISAISYSANINMMEPIFLAMLMEQERRIAALENRKHI